MASAANLGGVVDPRIGHDADAIGTTEEHRGSISREVQAPDAHGHNTIYLDDSITFETYNYWANRAREFEKHIRTDNVGLRQIGNLLIGKKIKDESPTLDTATSTSGETLPEKVSDERPSDSEQPSKELETSHPQTGGWSHSVTEAEWEQAQRATRTATWGSVFYLITTDILGPYNVPYALSQFGYGPGAALYTVFGGLACYSGLQLWKMFIGLDSTRYPLRNYGDLAFRIYGKSARIVVNVLQSIQFFLNITLIIESNGQGLAQMVQGANNTGYICFILAEVIFTIAGFILGQIRTLQRLGWLANLAIWLNIIVIIMTMVVVHDYPPNYAAYEHSYPNVPIGPVKTYANWPPGVTLIDRLNGVGNLVFAYGGATLFNELMAEMRRPMDFWKGFICAEIFIYCAYLIMGMVVYSAQGQFVFNPAYQGIPNSAYRFQTLGNAVSFISGLIAALLYGNIGIKVFYSAVLRDVFKFPPLDAKKGKLLWIALVPIYWVLAWIVAAAIPQISNLTSFVGILCILQFSYTFPPILMVGYNCQKDSILPEEGFDPRTGVSERVDGGWKRWVRGYKKKWALNTFDIIYSLGALALCGLGLYSSGTGMRISFSQGSLTPFTCQNPAGG